ncbi:effector-associated domain 2-containing protein [Streptomyces sp. NPDC055078]
MGELRPAAGTGRLRVLSARGTVHGAGVLVTPTMVLTCAHVVASATGAGAGGRNGPPPDAPAGPVYLAAEGPGVATGAGGATSAGGATGAGGATDTSPAEATVVAGGWFPGPYAGGASGDLAVLVTAPLAGTPARLGRCGEPDRREVSVYGHPEPVPDGLWATARLVGRGGPHHEWVQLEGAGTTGARIEPGFSGAGVWDPAAGRIIGLITAAYNERDTRIAWMLPTEAIARLWPGLHELCPDAGAPAASPTPPPAQLPSDAAQFAIADALLRVPRVEDDGAATLRRLLPAVIRHSVRDSVTPRLQTFYVVRACVDHRQGRRALADALRLIDDASEPARAALGLLDRVWPADPGGGAG